MIEKEISFINISMFLSVSITRSDFKLAQPVCYCKYIYVILDLACKLARPVSFCKYIYKERRTDQKIIDHIKFLQENPVKRETNMNYGYQISSIFIGHRLSPHIPVLPNMVNENVMK